MMEFEKTYLLKFFPEEMKSSKQKEIVDCYVPAGSDHPMLRIRKNGEKFEITKKQPAKDASEQTEETILLTEQEFNALRAAKSKDVSKVRHVFLYQGRTCEIDVFAGPLNGLVLVDFEFDSREEKDAFEMPKFCLADVTYETFIAGGMLAGKSFRNIRTQLDRFNYTAP